MRLVGYTSMGLLGRVGHKASESDLKKNELFLGGLNMDHNLSKITAAARCRPNKPPAKTLYSREGAPRKFREEIVHALAGEILDDSGS